MKRIAGLLAAATCAFGAGPVSALTISGTYYEDSVAANCGTAIGCTADFPLSSAISGKLLNLEHMSCLGFVNKPFSQGLMYLSDGDGINLRRFYGLSLVGPNAGGFFSWHEEVKYKITGGPPRVLNVAMNATAVADWSAVRCMIVGTISAQ